MNKYNISVLAEAKEEYTRQLVNIIAPHMYVGIKSIYDTASMFCRKTNDKNVLKKFQLLLATIPDWNQSKIEDEYKRISQNSECDWIEDLITAVFVSHTKVLSSIKLKKKSKPIELNVPEGPYFTHKCYIEIARNFWKKPYLMHLEFPNLEIQRNLSDAEQLIKDSVIECIRKLLPVKYILKEYLGNNFEDEDDEDITSDVSVNTKSNLRKLVKQEIEQSLTKDSEDKKDDKIENFSRIEIDDTKSDSIEPEEEDKESITNTTTNEEPEVIQLDESRSDNADASHEEVLQENEDTATKNDDDVTPENQDETVKVVKTENIDTEKNETTDTKPDEIESDKVEDTPKETKVIKLDGNEEKDAIKELDNTDQVIDLRSNDSINSIISRENREIDAKNNIENVDENTITKEPEIKEEIPVVVEDRTNEKPEIRNVDTSEKTADEKVTGDDNDFSFFEDAAPF